MTERRTSRISPFRRGDRVADRRKHNQPRDAINRLLTGIAPPLQIRRKGALSTTAKIQKFIVTSDQGDYLLCEHFDGTGSVAIAKPYLLRRSITSRASITYTYASAAERTATSGATTETQVIVPSYVADDVIYAAMPITGDTDVLVSGQPVDWIDLNLDARAWAKKFA